MNRTMQHFGLTENDVIRKDNDFYLPLTKLSQILDINKKNLLENIRRHKSEFGEIGVHLLWTPGGVQESYILNEEQVYLLCMISRSEKAKEFRRVFAKMIKGIRSKEFIHVSEYKKLLAELEKTREKLLKSSSEDILDKIPPRKLSRYKKYRKLGLSRKELCKALELPYQTMKKVDLALGFTQSKTPEHLIPYQIVKGGKRRYEIEPDLFSEAK